MKEKVAIIESLGAHGSSHHFYLYGQSRRLADNNVDVTLYTNNVTQNPNYEGVSFFTFYKNIFKGKSRILAGIKYIFGSILSLLHAKFSGVKICHFHLFHVNILVLFDFILTKTLRMKVVYTIHDVVSFENKKSNNSWSNWIFKKSDKILIHNSFSKKIFDNYYTASKHSVDIIPHGNYIPFLNVQSKKNKSRDRLLIPNDRTVLLFFGMIKKVKGLELLLEALKDVVQKNPDVLLLIGGRIWENDFSTYQQIIDKYNLSEFCLIHNKFIPHEDVEHYYSSSDIVVLPYKRIYQSGVLMMSLSYEKAVLVSDLEPLTELVKDNDTGFVFKSEDSYSLSTKLNIILSDKDNLEKIRKRGLELVKTKYDWLEIGKKTKKSYESIL